MLVVAVLLLAAPLPRGSAPEAEIPPAEAFSNGWSIGLAGCLQVASLAGAEDVLAARSDDLAVLGFPREDTGFGARGGFAFDLARHLTPRWAVSLRGDRATFVAQSRTGRTLAELGGSRDFVSVGAKTVVRPRPVLFTLGLRYARAREPVTLSYGVGLVVAPLEVVDTPEDWVDAVTSSATPDVRAKGTGLGVAADVTLDWLLSPVNSVFVRVLARDGSVHLRLEDPAWDTSFSPSLRRVRLLAGELALGVRWF